MMRAAACLVLLLAGCGGADFDEPKRVDAGRVVHYAKSNLDGSNPATVSLYIAGRDRIEVYTSGRGVVAAPIDWSHPVHRYDLDLMTLNAMLPYLRDRRQSFEFDVASRGTATARYMRKEEVNGHPVRRYSLAGAGMNGAFWVREADGYLEKFESPVPNDPRWTSLRLERRGTERMTPAQWAAFTSSARTSSSATSPR